MTLLLPTRGLVNVDQYMEGSEIERAMTIGNKALDAEIAKQEGL